MPKKQKKSRKADVTKRLHRAEARIFNIELTTRGKLQLLAVFLLFVNLILFSLVSYQNHGFIRRLCDFATDRDAVQQSIAEMGVFAPLAYIGLQILQTVVSPIPGNVVGLVGGLLFGWWGVFLTVFGSSIGYFIVLYLSRKLGRRFVERLVSRDLMRKFDYLSKERGTLVFFLIFLIPALPDDVVMYIAGLTNLPIKQILFLAIVGRLPSVVITNRFGSSIAENNKVEAIILAAISLVAVGICLWKRKLIMDLVGPRRKEIMHKFYMHIKKSMQKINKSIKGFVCKFRKGRK